MTADELTREVRRLVDRVSHWTPPRWAASAASGPGAGAGRIDEGRPDPPERSERDQGTRADLVHALAQRLADLGADTEGEPRRPVPRLPHDTALCDQIRVLAADLIAAAPGEVLHAAAQDVAATHRAL